MFGRERERQTDRQRETDRETDRGKERDRDRGYLGVDVDLVYSLPPEEVWNLELVADPGVLVLFQYVT